MADNLIGSLLNGLKMKKERKPNKKYELPSYTGNHKWRILSLDPGTRNMGIAVIGVGEDLKPRVLANSIITNPIASLVDNYKTNRQLFIEEVDQWFTTFRPHAIIGERFMTRGHGGPLIELVSTMNAVIGMMYPDLMAKFISASTWKNAWNRRHPIVLDEMYTLCRTTPHQLDACLIGIYGLEVALQTSLIYKPLNLLRQIEASSLLPLKRKRS